MKFFWIVLCLFLAQCGTKQARQETRQTPSPTPAKDTRLAYPRPDSAGRVFYSTQYYTPQALASAKNASLKQWREELQAEFGLPFKTLHFGKYFEVAYRCSEQEAAQLEAMTMPFFKEVYGRFFKYEPKHPFKIVYFVDKPEFTRCIKTTAYGVYRHAPRTLYTYSRSGDGTLWHELIHAFVDANIEHDVQQWFNEGFASFYEMAGIYQGKFYEGYTNWRLPLLQKMLKRKDYLPLPAFMAQDKMEETNGYAKARFLFCYLWRYDKMDTFVKKYLYDLSKRAKGEELGKLALAEMERLVGKSKTEIEAEFRKWATEMKPYEKLQKIKGR